jgi:hypothetical protein
MIIMVSQMCHLTVVAVGCKTTFPLQELHMALRQQPAFCKCKIPNFIAPPAQKSAKIYKCWDPIREKPQRNRKTDLEQLNPNPVSFVFSSWKPVKKFRISNLMSEHNPYVQMWRVEKWNRKAFIQLNFNLQLDLLSMIIPYNPDVCIRFEK